MLFRSSSYNAAELTASKKHNRYNDGRDGSSINSQINTDIIKVNIPDETERKIINAVCSLLKYFEGTTPVYVYYRGKINKKHRVIHSETLFNELESLLGIENVKFENGTIRRHANGTQYITHKQ